MRAHYFSDRIEKHGRSFRRFHSKPEALQFLRRVVREPGVLSDLRRWAGKHGGGGRSERDLLDHAAQGLVTGRLIVEGFSMEIRRGGAIEGPPVGGARRASGQSPSALQPRAPEPQRETAAPTPDVDQQVTALLAAAKNGAPFCEQCEKSKAEAAK